MTVEIHLQRLNTRLLFHPLCFSQWYPPHALVRRVEQAILNWFGAQNVNLKSHSGHSLHGMCIMVLELITTLMRAYNTELS
jgi:hypothetical protein